jgi:NAD(P)H dehydrogenase (quinone)
VIVGLTGATGHIGRRVAELLVERLGTPDGPTEVVATTRAVGKAADLADRGVQVRHADFDDPATLVPAFTGLDRLLIVSTDSHDPQVRIRQHGAAIDAAARAGVPHLVYTSFVNADRGRPASVAAVHQATEAALRDAGPAWTVLRNNLYADTLPMMLAAPGGGPVSTNAGSGRAAYVTREDCAAVAAAVLLAVGGEHAGQVYEVTGPQALTLAEAAEQFGRAQGRGIEVREVDDETFVQGMVAGGAPEPMARAFSTFGSAQREGVFDVVSDVVPRLTGRPAIPVSAVAKT